MDIHREKMIEIPKLKELSFSEKGHVYTLNGEVIPSVSEIMTPLKESHYKSIPDRVMEKAAEKGTEVHNAIENWIKFKIEDISLENKQYFDAFIKWWKKINPEVIGSEIPIYHKLLRYAGTIDLIASINGKLVLIDFKTTYTVIDMTCSIQLSGYENALKSHGISVDEKMILQLKKDGTFDDSHRYPSNDAERWRVFGQLKGVYDYIQKNK